LHVNQNDTNYWSEYKRYHNYLGYLRGPGVSREYPDRRSFNVLTGRQYFNFFVSVLIACFKAKQMSLVGQLKMIIREYQGMW
jgi:hypothetical protein